MASVTPITTMEVTTDSAMRVDRQPNALGIVAMMVAVGHNAAGAGNTGSLGFKIAADPLDMLALANQTGTGFQNHMYRPSGLTVCKTPVDPILLRYVKANNANNDQVDQLNAVAEIIGVFGQEDLPRGGTLPATVPAGSLKAHNNPYPDSPFARLIKAPAAPYIIHSGTYTGNGTGQDLIFRMPVHWFYVRKHEVGFTRTVGWWFSAMFAGHQTLVNSIQSDMAVQAFIDPSFVGTGGTDDQEQRCIVRITGADSEVNAAGGTYQYVAVEDPLGRFMLSGGIQVGAVDGTDDHALPNTNFLAESVFMQAQNNSAGAGVPYLKGLGSTAGGISPLNATETADFLDLATGLLRTRPAATISSTRVLAFAAWRRHDGRNDPNEGKCVQMGTYVGDGSASRTINFGPIGVRPLWCIVVPLTTAAILRDPAATGTTSYPISGVVNAATGITAGGIDSFTVGSALNTNAVTYNWFLLPGSATAGNGGWSIDGEFIPVEPDTPADGPFDDTDPDDFVDDPDADPDPDPGPSDTDDCEAGDVCVAATTRLVNLALYEIGSSKRLTNYCTQDTVEAQAARILFEPAVRSTLRDFPWPFATKYAALVLTAAQPANEDWDFSYRQPVDCIFERRLVVARGTAADPEGPGFMLSSDASGGLIFSNEANPVLEYTCRPSCVAFTGDPLFREALKWKLAAALAPPISRMADRAKECLAQYDLCIEKANNVIKPGVPGLRTTPDPTGPDAAAACITANIQVVNRGLLRIGARTIANLATEQSREAVAANLILEDEIRSTLRDYPWKFAKRYNDALVLVAGTDTVPANVDWQYSYRLPADYVMVRRLATEGTGRSFEPDPKTFEVGTDTTGELLFTGEIDPQLEYTARINCVVQKGDELFRDALAWRLAAALAPSLAQVDPETPEQHGRGPDAPPDPRQRIAQNERQARLRTEAAKYAFAMYLRTLGQAKAADANEAQPEKDGDAEWIRGRN